MSTQYYVSIVYGHPLTQKPTYRQVKDPLWGTCAYDPKTGRKVDEHTWVKIPDVLHLLDIHHAYDTRDVDPRLEGLDLMLNIYDDGYGRGHDFVLGRTLVDQQDVKCNWSLAEIPLLSPSEMASTRAKIESVLKTLDYPYDPAKVKLLLVPYCSY